MLILTTKVQGLLFDILGNNDVFPCKSAILTPIVYQNSKFNNITCSSIIFLLPSFKIVSNNNYIVKI